jgi:hypothetical protein
MSGADCAAISRVMTSVAERGTVLPRSRADFADTSLACCYAIYSRNFTHPSAVQANYGIGAETNSQPETVWDQDVCPSR